MVEGVIKGKSNATDVSQAFFALLGDFAFIDSFIDYCAKY